MQEHCYNKPPAPRRNDISSPKKCHCCVFIRLLKGFISLQKNVMLRACVAARFFIRASWWIFAPAQVDSCEDKRIFGARSSQFMYTANIFPTSVFAFMALQIFPHLNYRVKPVFFNTFYSSVVCSLKDLLIFACLVQQSMAVRFAVQAVCRVTGCQRGGGINVISLFRFGPSVSRTWRVQIRSWEALVGSF